MNLFLRLLMILIQKMMPRKRIHILDTARLSFTCLPHDCDHNLHMNNTRYASFCDLGRIAALFDQGAARKLVGNGYTPIISAQNVMHFKEIKIFKQFELESRIIGWTEKFWFYEHQFIQDGELKATVVAKGVWVRRRKLVPFTKVLQVAGYELDSPELPKSVRDWSEDGDEKFKLALSQARVKRESHRLVELSRP